MVHYGRFCSGEPPAKVRSFSQLGVGHCALPLLLDEELRPRALHRSSTKASHLRRIVRSLPPIMAGSDPSAVKNRLVMVSTKWLCSSIVMCSRSCRAILRANQVDFCFWRAASASLRAPRRAGSRSQFR
jgi:hypothetical protein